MSWDVLSLPFVRMALAAGMVVGITCSYLGVFVVLRRVVFVGITLAQLAALGVALSFYVPIPPIVAAMGMTLVGSSWLSWAPRRRRTPRDASIGVTYVTASALSILLVAKSAQGETHILGLLFGNILTVSQGQLGWLAAVSFAVLALQLVFWKPLLFVAFDPESAQSAGYRVRSWNLVFNVSLALVISVAIQVAGALLVFSYLLLPAVIGLHLSQRTPAVLTWGMVSAAAATGVGVAVSVWMDLPTGPTIVLVLAVGVVGSLLRRSR